jgi:hypothetical protein
MIHITVPAMHTANVGGSVMPRVTAITKTNAPTAAHRPGDTTTDEATHWALPIRGPSSVTPPSCTAEARERHTVGVRRWVAAIAAAVLLLVAVGGLVAWLKLRNGGRTTTVSAEDAVNQYRAAAASTTLSPTLPSTTASPTTVPTSVAPPAQLPAPGVYTYTTTGSDGVDALGGARHQYPITTTLTVTASSCGVTERWVAAVERWDETSVCLSPDGTGVSMVHFTGFHRFFGGDNTDDYACSGDPRPVGASAAGATWTTTCTGAEETVVHHGTVIGVEGVDVGGATERTVHVTDVEDDGDATDHQVIDTWYQEGTDLVVRRTSRIATSSSSPVGVVHYGEAYQIGLQSLTPQR